jgi:hypothetical protein
VIAVGRGQIFRPVSIVGFCVGVVCQILERFIAGVYAGFVGFGGIGGLDRFWWGSGIWGGSTEDNLVVTASPSLRPSAERKGPSTPVL